MATYDEPARPLEFLSSEANGSRSREKGTVSSGNGTLLPGRVMAKLSGEWVPYNNAAGDSSNVAAGILAYGVDATNDVAATLIVRDAEVVSSLLGWGSNDGTGITAGTADLLALGIIVRA